MKYATFALVLISTCAFAGPYPIEEMTSINARCVAHAYLKKHPIVGVLSKELRYGTPVLAAGSPPLVKKDRTKTSWLVPVYKNIPGSEPIVILPVKCLLERFNNNRFNRAWFSSCKVK